MRKYTPDGYGRGRSTYAERSAHADRDRSRARTAALMARMAAREPLAFAEFVDEHHAVLATIMRGHLASMGWRHPGDDEVHDLVMESALFLWDRAPRWDAGRGAAPWWWAAAPLRCIAASYLGLHATDIDGLPLADTSPDWTPVDADDPLELLRSVGIRYPVVDLLREALEAVASRRDQAIFLEVRQEAASGNRSPAVTVGSRWDMTSTAVRKVVQRVTQRLIALAEGDTRFQPLSATNALRPAA